MLDRILDVVQDVNLSPHGQIEKNIQTAMCIKYLINEYQEELPYDIPEGYLSDFTLPGGVKIIVDGSEAIIEMSSDILNLLYKIIMISTNNMEQKLEEGENVDLRNYI